MKTKTKTNALAFAILVSTAGACATSPATPLYPLADAAELLRVPSPKELALLHLQRASTDAVARDAVDRVLAVFADEHGERPADVCEPLRAAARTGTDASRAAVLETCDIRALDLRGRSGSIDVRTYRQQVARAARRARLEGDARTADLLEKRAALLDDILAPSRSR